MADDAMPSRADTGNGRMRGAGAVAAFDWAFVSEPGDVRPHNEDYAGVDAPAADEQSWTRAPLFVVADGMGGHAAGEVASRVATEAALRHWVGTAPQPPQAALRAAVRTANLAVYDAALEQRNQGMGTTLVAASLFGREVTTAHVGDSRAYLIHGDRCTQLTADHSRVAEMVRMKLISPEQAANHPARSMLTRSVGNDPVVQVDGNSSPVAAGDVLVLCSDGLWDVVGRTDLVEIGSAVVGAGQPATEAAEQLVGLALKRGTADNVTAMVVHITTDDPFPITVARRSRFGRRHA